MHHWFLLKNESLIGNLGILCFLWFFGSKIKDSYAQRSVRPGPFSEVQLAACRIWNDWWWPPGMSKPWCQTQPNPLNDPNPYYQNLWHYWYEKIWKGTTCVFSCFFMLFARCWVATCDGFQQRLENFRICPESCSFCPFALPGSCVQSSKQRSTEKHECFTKVSSNPLFSNDLSS